MVSGFLWSKYFLLFKGFFCARGDLLNRIAHEVTLRGSLNLQTGQWSASSMASDVVKAAKP